MERVRLTEFDRGYLAGYKEAQAQLARSEPAVSFGRLSHDRRDATFRFDGRPFHVTLKEGQLLAALMPGRLLTFEGAISQLWPMGETSSDVDRLLKVYVHKVRQKIRDVGGPRDQILSVWGVGWRLNPAASPPAGRYQVLACQQQFVGHHLPAERSGP